MLSHWPCNPFGVALGSTAVNRPFPQFDRVAANADYPKRHCIATSSVFDTLLLKSLPSKNLVQNFGGNQLLAVVRMRGIMHNRPLSKEFAQVL